MIANANFLLRNHSPSALSPHQTPTIRRHITHFLLTAQHPACFAPPPSSPNDPWSTVRQPRRSHSLPPLQRHFDYARHHYDITQRTAPLGTTDLTDDTPSSSPPTPPPDRHPGLTHNPYYLSSDDLDDKEHLLDIDFTADKGTKRKRAPLPIPPTASTPASRMRKSPTSTP